MTQRLKNIAIVAHVDHGKTTLVDGLLKQSGTFDEREEVQDRVMDSGEIERERGITITAKNCAAHWKDHKINILDTPGHADFGGEVERSLMMVDGILLLVDASEGPLPQTRFVLQKAMERDLKIAVVINKIDRPDRRIDEVKVEIEDLFLELASLLNKEDFDLDIPFLYACAKDGWATLDPEVQTDNMNVILDFFVSDFYPYPQVKGHDNLQILVSNLSYSEYLGAQFVGRVESGTLKRLGQCTVWQAEGKKKNFKVTSIQVYDKLGNAEVDEAGFGEIVIVSGLDDAQIGDTICDRDQDDRLPRIEVEPPTVSVNVSVSTSPLSGREGEYLTSRKLEEFLQTSCRQNVALKYEATDDPKVYKLYGRGELQIAIVFEQLRRSGYEVMLSRPEVVIKTTEEGKVEPFELVVIDIPAEFTGAVTEALGKRKGTLKNMAPIGERTRIEFEMPSRGLIGYRSQFLTDTKGEGLMSTQFLDFKPFAGKMLNRQNGAMIADRSGKATPYALFNLLSVGKQFISPGEEVYEGMVVGEHSKTNDTNLNCIRAKHLSSMRTAGKDVNIVLPPPVRRTLEWALDWIDDDEWVEVTPKTIRIRKKVLEQNKRTVVRTERKEK